MLQIRSRLKSGFLAPCLPNSAPEPPSGAGWVHEIKHDGFRIMARRVGARVWLYTRNAYDFGDRFPQIVEAISNLPVQSCFIDGEAIVADERGLSVFDLLRYRCHDHAAVLCAFDLIELNGDDLRPLPIEHRKDRLGKLLNSAQRLQTSVTLNEHYEGQGAVIYNHVCKFGCEGIVSKRLGSRYQSGRSGDWVKIKNPAAPAVRREAGEDWGRKRHSR
jgi:bifunctional non-homologous end joining protein LigD